MKNEIHLYMMFQFILYSLYSNCHNKLGEYGFLLLLHFFFCFRFKKKSTYVKI